jgi:hypothetical protein
MSVSDTTIKGSCLCGAVRFELTSAILSMGNCHCEMCRKQHGTAFSTYCQVLKSGLRIREGESHVQRYASSDFAERSFCANCGTKLTFTIHDLPDRIWVSAGALDDDPGLVPEYHIFVGSKAPWYEISDEIPQYEGYPDKQAQSS